MRFSLISLIFFVFVSNAFAQNFAIIAHPDTPSLSESDIKGIYLGFKKEIGGIVIKPFVLKGDGARKSFFEFLGISESEFKSSWLSKALAGEGTPPKELTYDEIIQRVKTEKGAIAVIPADKIPEGVKIILKK